MYLIDRPDWVGKNEITTVRYLFLIFVITPVLEMWLLINVGAQIGALPTIGLVLLTAFVGVSLLRYQGFDTLWRGQRRFAEGQLPAQEIAEGIILAVSGALLLTPGFVTDAIGFAGLIPMVRGAVARLVLSRMVVSGVAMGSSASGFSASGGRVDLSASAGSKKSNDIIEGESWDEK
jgi:UPF0716 protein FxsA